MVFYRRKREQVSHEANRLLAAETKKNLAALEALSGRLDTLDAIDAIVKRIGAETDAIQPTRFHKQGPDR